MKNQTKKKFLYARHLARVRKHRLDEDLLWQNIIPVGREFGSQDYETRLMSEQLAPSSINAKSKRVTKHNSK